MKQLTLKEILSREDVQSNIKANLFKTNEELKDAVDKTIESKKDNVVSVVTTRDGVEVDFENTLHIDTEKKVYFLECRLFSKSDDQMINSYLELFDSEGKIIEGYTDDVWEYADWKVVK